MKALLGELSPEEVAMFMGTRTTIDDIKAAGWEFEASSGGNWWWRHKETRRCFVPFWVLQVELEAGKRGANGVRNTIKEALGIKSDF